MNENNDYRPENEGYSNPDNLYHYNYRSQEDQGRHETCLLYTSDAADDANWV